MLGVHQPDFGLLTDAMVCNEGETVDAGRLIQPKAEGEIAFLLKRRLQGPGVTAADVLSATEGVMACFEIVDQEHKAHDVNTVAALAEHLESCQLQARDTPNITDEYPGMDWDDAYAIQAEILRRKLARGERLVGLKCGLT